ncbi:4-hydroxyphenylpyruvate dioxygenase [Mesoterricola silvestris]|uniref:4-hydroxyphenylpyruvate dioxygenase n=1 Tax=Mesoterricola silvestris TaxID=2927979 RepID=A0AA48GIR5_9BACT|nr:4-hydroxyphenylpyruvate dioxygenase [Mesoterricola silvestris]BDU72042.1 4-hydroxyphenylpyruvate dioxygenase [Mesoterricola silvestris]
MTKTSFALSTPTGRAATNPLGIERIDHFQMTGVLDRLEPLYRRLGFSRVASGKAPWGRLVHLRQNRMDVLILEADDTHWAGRYFQAHGEGVCALNFQVADLDAALASARRSGAKVMLEPETHHHGDGMLRFAAIKGVGDVLNYLVERTGEVRPFWSFLHADPGLPLCEPGLVRVDHLTNNVGPGEMDPLVDFYERVFGFTVTRTFNIRGHLGTGLNSKVVQSANGRVIIPINEPTDAKSQIQEFVNRHGGQGVQHIAMSTNGIQETLAVLRAQGFQFLKVPATYYELLPGRIEKGGYKVTEDLAEIEAMGIQVDGDATGYLLQIFSEDQIGPLFFEIIQRRGNMGFGEGNFQALYDSIELDQRRRGVL